MERPIELIWWRGVPPKVPRLPYLIQIDKGFDVISWVPETESWHQGVEGLGEDRYDDEELAEVYYAPLGRG